MKKVLAATLAVCLLLSVSLCGCKKKGEENLVSYDNAPDSAYSYEIVDDEVIITGFNAQNRAANIPPEIDGKPVTKIKAEAFKLNNTLEELNMPESILTVGENAFAGCHKLRAVSFSPKLQEIGEGSFYDCIALTSIHFPASLNRINASAFNGCTALTNIAFPDDPMYIGADAFAGTPWLNQKTGGDFIYQNGTLLAYTGTAHDVVSVKGAFSTISAAFTGNEKIKKIILPDSVKYITTDAFSGCTALEEISLGNGLISVEENAFAGCTALTEITFPKSVQAINANAFSGCTKLTTVKGVKGSAAEKFAKTANLQFVAA